MTHKIHIESILLQNFFKSNTKHVRFDAIRINLELQMIYEKVFTTTLIKVLVTY